MKAVIAYFISKGFKAIPYPMAWGGPFDDAVVIYGNEESNVNKIIRLINSEEDFEKR